MKTINALTKTLKYPNARERHKRDIAFPEKSDAELILNQNYIKKTRGS
jgi:hypothetical protein